MVKAWMLGLGALCVLGCAGRSTQHDAGSAGAENAGGAANDSVIPPRGFYRKTIMTTSDSCTWEGTAAGDIVLVGTSQTGVAAPLGPSNLQQEMSWQGLSLKLPGCNTVISAHAVSRSETAFVLDVSEDWPMPDKCGLTPAQIPASPCSGEWVETFKLVVACPASVDRVTCD